MRIAMKDAGVLIRKVFDILYQHYGKQNWWPGESKLEIVIGAILVQRTNWRNAAKGIQILKKNNLLEIDRLASIDSDKLKELIKPIGLAEGKAKCINELCKYLMDKCSNSLDELLNKDDARELLLSIRGIGSETADSILLYAADRATVPIGEYTRRILSRVGVTLNSNNYKEWQRSILNALPKDVQIYKEFHAVFVAHGKNLCKKRPICERCPLLHLCQFGKSLNREKSQE
ncbi:MAG: endonuclease [Nitrososphaerota archaeon]|nr:endonuclease [Nitrososphaerota archaeon]